MNAKPANPPLNEMTDADLDRALGSESDGILPSSGFAAGVMAAVVHDATAPAPIPFPWKRALPGLAAVIAAAVLLIVAVASVLRSSAASDRIAPAFSIAPTLTAALAHHGSNVLWIAVAFAIPLVCLLFCRRLISAR
jgi:hypothetical protein